jgi:hypothetical protein
VRLAVKLCVRLFVRLCANASNLSSNWALMIQEFLSRFEKK